MIIAAIVSRAARFGREHRFILLASLLFILFGVNNYVWLRMNTIPPNDDLGFHLGAALDCQRYLQDLSARSMAGLWSYTVAGFYPPLFHACMGAFNIVFGTSPVSSIMANMLFLALLFVSLYFIGKKMGNTDIGLLAAFIAVMYPYVFAITRFPFPDFALLAVVALSFCLLLYTDGFSNRAFSALFGLSLGIGLLVKQVYAPFIAGPLCVAIWYLLFPGKPPVPGSRVNALIALGIGAGILLAWYMPKMSVLLPRYMNVGYGASIAMSFQPELVSFESLSYYLKMMAFNQMRPFFFAAFVAGGMLYLARRGNGRMKAMLLSGIVLAYLAFTFIAVKQNKTTVPFLVFAAIITSAGLLSLKWTALRRTCIGLVIAFGLFQYFDVSYLNGALTGRHMPLFRVGTSLMPVAVTESFSPVGGDWKIAEVIEELDLAVIRAREMRRARIYFGLSDKFHSGLDPERPHNFYVTNLYPVAYYHWAKEGGKHAVEPFSLRLGWRDDIEMLVLSEKLEYSACPAEKRKYYRFARQLTMPDGSPVYIYHRSDPEEPA